VTRTERRSKLLPTGKMTMKKQTGLSIIKLMILLLIAGIVGSLAINVLIRHRYLADPAAQICTEKVSVQNKGYMYALVKL
jgi:hypothetical protein